MRTARAQGPSVAEIDMADAKVLVVAQTVSETVQAQVIEATQKVALEAMEQITDIVKAGAEILASAHVVPTDSLAVTNPEVAKDWHPTKNTSIVKPPEKQRFGHKRYEIQYDPEQPKVMIGRGNLPTNKMDKKAFHAMVWRFRANLGLTHGLNLGEKGKVMYEETRNRIKHLSPHQQEKRAIDRMKEGEKKAARLAEWEVANAYYEKSLALAEKYPPRNVYAGTGKGAGETNTIRARKKAERIAAKAATAQAMAQEAAKILAAPAEKPKKVKAEKATKPRGNILDAATLTPQDLAVLVTAGAVKVLSAKDLAEKHSISVEVATEAMKVLTEKGWLGKKGTPTPRAQKIIPTLNLAPAVQAQA
jgi:hypothetical protein